MTERREEKEISEEKKVRFSKVYSNLPMEERTNPIVVIDDEPISWKAARREVHGETELGARILDKLIELDII